MHRSLNVPKVDCAACDHVALLTPDFLLRLGLSPQAKVLDLKVARQVPRMRSAGTSRRFNEVGDAGEGEPSCPDASGRDWDSFRETRLSRHNRSQRADNHKDDRPKPERQEQDHEQRRSPIEARIEVTLARRSRP